ncbi:uncharacterized protein LOC134258244 [Saccostrea cucullata]|uniref:uncharacterized protein LOC134258244 n=1 Tax=Saccostrea cuccullata TaxID=36930 RepID=UPI002ED0765B
MSSTSKYKPYSCITCCKRIKTSERRPLYGNQALRKFLSKRFLKDLSENDVVCNKCRQLYYFSLKQGSKIPEVHNTEDKENAAPPDPVTLPILSTGYRHDACGICEKKPRKLVVIPEQARLEMFVQLGVFMKEGSRCCPSHIYGGHLTSEALSYGVSERVRKCTSLSNDNLRNLLDSLRNYAKKNASTRLDFDSETSLSAEDYRNLTGLTRTQFDDLMLNVEDIKTSKSRSIRTCVAILLMKLRCALDNKMLATLFNMKKWQVRRAVSSARRSLMKDFVPQNLGFGHISRDDVIQKHTRPLAQELFSPGMTETPALLVLDGTYIYIQKSNNFTFFRRSYSLHKHRPLVKPMMVVTTSGYIVSVLGPYLADSKNNDAGILTHMIERNAEEMRNWLQDGDTFIVDRGFRDSTDILADIGIRMEMPSFLKGAKQHSTEESNSSRLITKVRWVVESANGRIKRWKYLDRTVSNNQIPFIADYVRIVAAISNRYCPPLSTGTDDDQAIAMKMRHLSQKGNELRELVESEGWDRRPSQWKTLDADSVALDFPILSEDEIRNITLGTYQVKMARAYTHEHFQEDGAYDILIAEDKPNIIGAKIQSRHVSAKKYLCWIRHSEGVIVSWYCKCKAGSRVVGCCAHITSVLWYLSFARHQSKPLKGVRNWADHLEDAVDESDSGAESPTEE